MADESKKSIIKKFLGLIPLIIVGILISKFYINPEALRSEVEQLLTPFSESVTQPKANVYTLGNKGARFLTTVVQTQLAQLSSHKSKLLSNSNLTIQGHFKIAAGFDLDKSTSIVVSSFPRALHVTVAPPEILAVEMSNNTVLNDDKGIWTNFSHQEHAEMIASMSSQAQQAAIAGGILEVAKEKLEEQIIELAESYGVEASEVSVEFISNGTKGDSAAM